MHIERMHKMIEKLTECALCEIEKGIECVNTEEMGAVIDMIKDLSCAEKDALIAKEMKKEKEDEEAEEKYMMRMLKEEYKDEYKRMKDEYGEEDGERRFYDSWRYADGRFAPKGSGSYHPRSSGRRSRRGYVEPPYYHVMPEDYNAEWYRDMDRKDGKMYYTPTTAANANSSSMRGLNRTAENSGQTYADGYNAGQTRGYSEGYERGRDDGRRSGSNSQSRFDRAKRGYEETKEMHKGNTPEDKQMTMKEAEKFVNVILDELEDALADASPEVKNMVKSKTVSKMQKMN